MTIILGKMNPGNVGFLQCHKPNNPQENDHCYMGGMFTTESVRVVYDIAIATLVCK